MHEIREYILSVGAAGLLCAVTARLTAKNGPAGKALKLVTGLFMLLTLLQPFGRFRLEELTDYFDEYARDAKDVVSLGENRSALALQNSIKEALASYILDKGAAQGAKLQVQIRLDEAIPPNLLSVSLSGDISPYGKRALHEVLCHDLGLANEDIIWQ